MQENGYLNISKPCSRCLGKNMNYKIKKSKPIFRCSTCRTENSIFEGTIFKNKNLNVSRCLIYFIFGLVIAYK
jgi:hypothetical protein